MKEPLFLSFIIGLICLLSFNCQKKPGADSYEEVLRAFQNPPPEFRSVPFWVWNDRVTKEQIEAQFSDFKAQGIGAVFIHPRPGLITPYLSEEWLSLCRHAVDIGKALGMRIWLYDENSYPSGFAGGHVPAQMPDAARTGLRLTRATELPEKFAQPPLLILSRGPSGFEDVTQSALKRASGSGDYFIFDLLRQNPSPWYGGFTYVDLMRKDVTEKFLDVTHNSYKRVIGDEFGAAVPGVFQDEAEIGPAGGKDSVNYTPSLFDEFEAKWGYDLRLHLPSLFEEIGDWQQVRHNYYQTLLDLFIENWAKPYYDYCTANNLIFTGHYWDHEWPIPRLSPDNMAMYEFSHMPGIDCLMNDWETHPHAQFGNARSVKEIRSAANQLGKSRTLSETYGASGWDLTFFDQKRIGDWEYALGVNFLNQHLSYVTIKGARKRDHPLSFSYHEPWWRAYKVLADYFARLSAAMSAGKQVNLVLVLEPTTTAWMYYSPAGQTGRFKAVGSDFQNFINRLEAEQIEYDLGSEAILKNHGRVRGKKLIVGQSSYELLILPPGLENLNEPTAALLSDYLAQGGRVLSWNSPPEYIEGKLTDRIKKLAARYQKNWISQPEGSGLEKIKESCPQGIDFKDPGSISGLLFHHCRSLKDCELVFLANASGMQASSGKFTASGRSVEKWEPFKGKAYPYPFTREKDRLEVNFALPPGGSLLLCLRRNRADRVEEPGYHWNELRPEGELEIKREAPNVLTLDYCDLSLGGRIEKDLYFYDAQLKVFRHHGLERNPWDSAVQFKTNILDLDKFGPDSGFEASYWFQAAKGANLASLEAVVERPELYQVSINGQAVRPLKDKWWLDRAFGVFDIGAYAREGKNKITLRSSPFTIHSELEPVYLLGDFRLSSLAKGFELIPSTELKAGTWAGQGLPFYSGGVRYERIFSIPSLDSKKEQYYIQLGGWQGAVAEVRVGEKTAGFIAFLPYELEITEELVPGINRVSVIVYGTLKNTLGPHHNNPQLGRAWPGSFQQGAKGGFPPGSSYSLVGYGLLEDFKLRFKTRE
jgi:hypothetical protein